LAPDSDDPFADLQADSQLKLSSYGVHVDAQLEAVEKVDEAKAYAKAVKADGAEVPLHLWNERIRSPGVTREKRDTALTTFWKLGHCWFLRGLAHDCSMHMQRTHGEKWHTRPRSRRDGELTKVGKDQCAIAGILWHATHTNWFEFHAGLRLVHLRFPIRYRKMARDNVPVFFERPGPTTLNFNRPWQMKRHGQWPRKKILKVIKRRYLLMTGIKVKSLIKYFAVPKGEDDIRLIYNAMASKLNECVWVPTFWFPTVDLLVRALDKDSWMTDRDVGDMFLNFQLHRSVVPFTGVDLSLLYDGSEELGPRWAVWDRNLIGFAASTYNSIKMALIAEEICKGDCHDERVGLDGKELNPFQWKRIRLNLLGTKEYDPCLSRISKIQADGCVACDCFTFVDDERVNGPDKDLTWQASHTLAAKQSYLGLQDASRKARPSSQQPGAWAGVIVHIMALLGVCVLTSVEKWAKMKSILEKWWVRLEDRDAPELAHKELLSDSGFLVYVTRTYPAMVPYLKGFHLTIEMWQGGRDADGWKLQSGDDLLVNLSVSLSSLDVMRAGGHGMDLGSAALSLLLGSEDKDVAAANHRVGLKGGET
jgi:hypothetical protein